MIHFCVSCHVLFTRHRRLPPHEKAAALSSRRTVWPACTGLCGEFELCVGDHWKYSVYLQCARAHILSEHHHVA